MAYCIYLRKSRADVEAEERGEGETLARHKAQLMALAAQRGFDIEAEYREIASGDTIAARPEMQRLLADVQDRRWEGVLVTEIERLARGDTIDQGIVAQTFRYSDTKIITPLKSFDPNNEFDSEYFEFGLFMARREYSAIKRRLWAGRVASAREGKYASPKPVYGYQRKKLDSQRGWTLEIDPDAAKVVRSIFDWYLHGMDGRAVGAGLIANRLNDMGLRTYQGNLYEASHIRNILQNPTYIGKIRWNQRTTVRQFVNGQRTSQRVKTANPIIVDGLHPSIIDPDTFDAVQRMFEMHEKRPKSGMRRLANPLAGLVRCSVCGRTMQRKNSYDTRGDLLHCSTFQCPTTGIYISAVEQAILEDLRGWIKEYASPNTPASEHTIDNDALTEPIKNQIAALDRQMSKLHDLLEQGIYDTETFVARRAELTARRKQLQLAIAESTPKPDVGERIIQLLPRIADVVAAYDYTTDPEERNALLRSVIDHIDYAKTKQCFRNENPSDYLVLTIYPTFVDR